MLSSDSGRYFLGIKRWSTTVAPQSIFNVIKVKKNYLCILTHCSVVYNNTSSKTYNIFYFIFWIVNCCCRCADTCYVFLCHCCRYTQCDYLARTSHHKSSSAWVTIYGQCSLYTIAVSVPTSTSACKAKTAPITEPKSFSTEVSVFNNLLKMFFANKCLTLLEILTKHTFTSHK